MRLKAIVPCAILLALTAVAQAGNPNDIFIVRATSKTPDATVAAIKSYSEQKKWQYVGDSKVKNGEVRLVKICLPEVGNLIWPVGLQLSAYCRAGTWESIRRAA